MSHKHEFVYDSELDLYKFNSLKKSDCLNIDLQVGEFFMAPQKLVHSGGPSKSKVIHLDDEDESLDNPLDLKFTHVALHVDFCLTESIHHSSDVADTTCYVSLNNDDN